MRTPLWTEGLLEYAQDPAIGIVGGKLRAPDGRLVHVGIVTGVRGVAAHLFESAPADSFGWNGGAVTVRNYSVVSGAMMMFRRSIWEEVGGFDERFHVDFADVDFCLRVRDAGYRIVFTPFVEGIAHQSVAHVPDPRDETAMQMKWGDALTRDPYYNPNLDRGFTDCRL
jgi:GT2 family glycosyltransferase